MTYFVYELSHPKTHEVFYVGFGARSNRPYDHVKEAQRFIRGDRMRSPNFIKLGIIRQLLDQGLSPVVTVVFKSDDRQNALDHEISLIQKYGRRNLGTGPLANLTDGGEGMKNNVNHWSRGHTKDTHPGLKKVSESLKGNVPWNKGIPGPTGKDNSFFGRKHSLESKALMSSFQKGRMSGYRNHKALTFKFISPNGEEFLVTGEFAKFCQEKNLPQATMRKVLLTGKATASGAAQGWLVIKG